MKRLALLLLLAGCVNPNPYSAESFRAQCEVSERQFIENVNPVRRRNGFEPLGENEFSRGVASCQELQALMANSAYRTSPGYRAQQEAQAVAVGVVFGAASDALWINNMRRSPLATIAPYRRQ